MASISHSPVTTPEILRQARRAANGLAQLSTAEKNSILVAMADAFRDRLDQIYREAKLAPPTVSEVFKSAGVTTSDQARARKLLQVLIDSGLLLRVEGEMFFHRDAVNNLIAKLGELAERKKEDRLIDVSTFKEFTGISRKYAIPLLEYLDRQRVTQREGDQRRIL